MMTPELANSITTVELAFSTSRLLPEKSQIPAEFFDAGNEYVNFVDAMLDGCPQDCLPPYTLKPGFEIEPMTKCLLAHLWAPDVRGEHKRAGLAYMFAQMAVLN
jgi:hypothetical protein